MIKRLFKRLILWALGDEYPKIVVVQKTDQKNPQKPPVAQMTDIRIPKAIRR